MDNLTNVLRQIKLRADVFFSGNLCGIQSFQSSEHGHLHLLQTGSLTLLMSSGEQVTIDVPSVIFIPGPLEHRILSQSEGAELVCATVDIDVSNRTLLINSLPKLIFFPLSVERTVGQTARWLFDEAFAETLARQVMIDKLSEIFLIQVLRYVIKQDLVGHGVLSALTHASLSRAISVMHNDPGHDWTVESLATIAAMSRSKFAATFKDVVGNTPSDYLTNLRMSIAQELLRDNKPVSIVANKIGYEHGSAFSRVFKKKLGQSPKQWLKSVSTSHNKQ